MASAPPGALFPAQAGFSQNMVSAKSGQAAPGFSEMEENVMLKNQDFELMARRRIEEVNLALGAGGDRYRFESPCPELVELRCSDSGSDRLVYLFDSWRDMSMIALGIRAALTRP
jgi:hypothetical protein